MAVSDRHPGEDQALNAGTPQEIPVVQLKPARGFRLPWNIQLDPGALVLSGLIFWFAGIHLRLWIAHPGVFVGLGQVLLELVQGALFIVRRRDNGGRRPAAVWIATMVGSWGFLLARPAAGAYFDSPFLFGAQPA